jgi:hypothetical protein
MNTCFWKIAGLQFCPTWPMLMKYGVTDLHTLWLTAVSFTEMAQGMQ